MNFRFFDDLVNSAPVATQDLGLGNENIKQKNYSAKKNMEIFLENLH